MRGKDGPGKAGEIVPRAHGLHGQFDIVEGRHELFWREGVDRTSDEFPILIIARISVQERVGWEISLPSGRRTGAGSPEQRADHSSE